MIGADGSSAADLDSLSWRYKLVKQQRCVLYLGFLITAACARQHHEVCTHLERPMVSLVEDYDGDLVIVRNDAAPGSQSMLLYWRIARSK